MVNSRGTHTVLSGKAAGGTIRLVHPRWADFDAWVALRRENAEYLKPWEPAVSDLGLNRVAYRGRLSRLKKLVQQDRAYPFHIFRGDNLVGACNITHIERSTSQSAKLFRRPVIFVLPRSACTALKRRFKQTMRHPSKS